MLHALLAVLTFSPVGRPLNSGVSWLASTADTQLSTVKPRLLLTTFSPSICSIWYFLLQHTIQQKQ
jgi:hypothetical protein